MNIKELILTQVKLPLSLDKQSGYIFDADMKMVAETRGWSWIQKLDNPEEFQDKMGQFFVDCINASITALSTNNAESKEVDLNVMIAYIRNKLSPLANLIELADILLKEENPTTAFKNIVDKEITVARESMKSVVNELQSMEQYATQNITHTEGRELKDITSISAYRAEQALKETYHEDDDYLQVAVSGLVDSLRRGEISVLDTASYKVVDYLRQYYVIPNQYSTPSASVDWDDFRRKLYEILPIPETVNQVKVFCKDYLKHHFKPADKVGEWVRCSDRLPEDGETVYGWQDGWHNVERFTYDESDKAFYYASESKEYNNGITSEYKDEYPTHWTHENLPSPPQN